MPKTWFSSDPHAYHKNISGPTVSEWKGGYRNFDNEIVMTDEIVRKYNQYVAEDDVLYLLGDFAFGGIHNIWNFRKRINCKTIHLIMGNHDHHIRANKELPNAYCHTDVRDLDLDFREYEESVTGITSDVTHRKARAFELFSSVQEVLEVNIQGHNFFLSHYGHRVWIGSHKGYIHLYGHSHGTLPPHGKSMDVGVDVAFALTGEYRPFSLEEIVDFMKTRPTAFVDGHNESTNVH